MNTRLREIPEGSVEVQPGLWAFLREYTVGGQPRARYLLYSAEGYCFYLISNSTDPDTGDLFPEYERLYYQYLSSAYTTIDMINEDVVSVPVQDEYRIAGGVEPDHEIM